MGYTKHEQNMLLQTPENVDWPDSELTILHIGLLSSEAAQP